MAHYTGTAVGPKGDPVLRGCSAEEQAKYTLRRGAFDAMISPTDGAISAGDGVHEGVWEKDGIRWNDGNKWRKL